MKTSHAHATTAATTPVRMIKTRFETEKESIHSILRVQHFPIFANISPPLCNEIISAGLERNFPAQQSIFFQGDAANQIFLLISGCVKLTQMTANGAEVILRLSGPSELIGDTGFGFKGPHRSTAQAMRLSRAVMWDSVTFAALVRKCPILQQNLIRIIEKNLMELEERFQEISTANVGGRLSREISRLATRVGEPANGGVKLNLSREELAQMTGTTLFTVSRMLSQWKNKGILSTGRQCLTVHNSKELANLFASD